MGALMYIWFLTLFVGVSMFVIYSFINQDVPFHQWLMRYESPDEESSSSTTEENKQAKTSGPLHCVIGRQNNKNITVPVERPDMCQSGITYENKEQALDHVW